MESAWHGGVSRLFSVNLEAIFIAEHAIVVIHRKVKNGSCPVYRFCIRGVASRSHNRSSHKTIAGNHKIKSPTRKPDVWAPNSFPHTVSGPPASNCGGNGYPGGLELPSKPDPSPSAHSLRGGAALVDWSLTGRLNICYITCQLGDSSPGGSHARRNKGTLARALQTSLDRARPHKAHRADQRNQPSVGRETLAPEQGSNESGDCASNLSRYKVEAGQPLARPPEKLSTQVLAVPGSRLHRPMAQPIVSQQYDN